MRECVSYLCRNPCRNLCRTNKVLFVIDTVVGRAGPARRRATRRSRVGTPLPVPTGPVPKRSVPTRLRRVAHSNGRAIRLGIRTAVNAGRRRRATRRSRVGTPHSDAPRVRHATQAKFVVARRPRAWPLLPAPQDLAPRRLRNLDLKSISRLHRGEAEVAEAENGSALACLFQDQIRRRLTPRSPRHREASRQAVADVILT